MFVKEIYFFFFGWFQFVDYINGRFSKVQNTDYPNGFHMLYGYLKIGEIHDLKYKCSESVKTHPHFKYHEQFVKAYRDNNTIYEAAEYFDSGIEKPGAGLFKFNPDLILTEKGKSTRTVWSLPNTISLKNGIKMGYHTNSDRWSSNGKNTILKSVAKGQEFVVSEDPHRHFENWARNKVLSN